MTEPLIACPKCNHEIKLTESLAAPLIKSTRDAYEKRIAQKDIDTANREVELRAREEAIVKEKESLDQQIADKLKFERAKLSADAAKRDAAMKAREDELNRVKETLDEQIAEKLKNERTRITADEARKAKLLVAADIELRDRSNEELKQQMHAQAEKLKVAQQAQADAMKKERALDEQKRELELTIERRVNDSLSEVRDKARRDVEDQLQMKVVEKDQMIHQLGERIAELQRKVEQGSQQAQGEAAELLFEEMLTTKFPFDLIEAVPKGEHGGDVLHRILGPGGLTCGTILWEFKRTKKFDDKWLPKLRDDQRTAKADLAVLVSATMPQGIEHFDENDSVWITHPRTFLPVALCLRQRIIEVAGARAASDGQQTKMEMVYHYLTGQKFRQRVEGIAEAFTTMQEDLYKEKKVIMKQWEKRQMQIDRAMQSTIGMYGDLQGIAGKTLKEIDGLDFKQLEGEKAEASKLES